MHNLVEKRKILFVDDDPSFLGMVEKLFGLWSQNAWEIVKVSRLEQALTAVEQVHVHVIVIDVYVPGKDGVAFLRSLHKIFPAVPKIVLTDNATDAVREECLENGAEFYLEKPKTLEGLESVFKLISNMAHAQLEGGFKGTLWVIGLHEVLQLECLHRRSSIVEFTSGRYKGRIFIQQGSILHAEVGHFGGTIALSFILALKGGEFEIKPFSTPARVTIQGQWELLLMEAAHQQDERTTHFFKESDGTKQSAK